jgi:hypothetical protein
VELLARARRNFWRVWEPQETIVRPVLEYGAEVDKGKWGESKKLQLMAGRMCLGVGREVADDVVNGELGWWTMEGRRRYLRLVYWAKLVREEGSVVGVVYRQGRRDLEEGKG